MTVKCILCSQSFSVGPDMSRLLLHISICHQADYPKIGACMAAMMPCILFECSDKPAWREYEQSALEMGRGLVGQLTGSDPKITAKDAVEEQSVHEIPRRGRHA